MKTGSKDGRVRGWRSWGGAMPAPRSSRRRVAYLFRSPRPQVERAAEAAHGGDPDDGRLAVDSGAAGNADRLLDRLREVHGLPRTRSKQASR